MTDLTQLGVAAIRDGVAKGDFTAVEVAEAFNAFVGQLHSMFSEVRQHAEQCRGAAERCRRTSSRR